MPTLEANGIDIYYEVHGEGDPVLLISGLATDLTQTKSLIDYLSKTSRVIAFDNRGSGRSEKPDSPYTVRMMSDDAVGLIQALELRQVDVLGISMGGRIAISLVLTHPEFVKRLVLVSTSARTNFDRGMMWSLSNLLLRIPMIRKVGTQYPQPYYAYVRQRDSSKGYDATSRLGEIRVPTLIIHGRKDRFVPFSLAEEIHTYIGGSKLISVEGGHLFPMTRQEDVAKMVADFLKSRVDDQIGSGSQGRPLGG